MLEKWITPSVFKNSQTMDEFSLSSQGKKYQKRIRLHQETFIGEKDFKWLHNHHINIVRIPIGYWLYGDEPPYVQSINRLDWAFEMAEKYKIHIFLSIHGAPGSQNGKMHSGKKGEIGWHNHTQKLSDFTQKIVTRYKKYQHFWGIELLNEPSPRTSNLFRLINYYLSMIKWIKTTSPHLKIVISDGFRPMWWAFFCRFTDCILDLHVYHGFGKTSHTHTLESLKQYEKKLSRVTKITPTLVGEWSAVSTPKTPLLELVDYFLSQKKLYTSVTMGNFFWTYKSEGGGSWDYKNMTQYTEKDTIHT